MNFHLSMTQSRPSCALFSLLVVTFITAFSATAPLSSSSLPSPPTMKKKPWIIFWMESWTCPNILLLTRKTWWPKYARCWWPTYSPATFHVSWLVDEEKGNQATWIFGRVRNQTPPLLQANRLDVGFGTETPTTHHTHSGFVLLQLTFRTDWMMLGISMISSRPCRSKKPPINPLTMTVFSTDLAT